MKLFVLILSYALVTISNAQSYKVPDIILPEDELQKWGEQEKLDNPIFLNGAVKEVKKAKTSYDYRDNYNSSKNYYSYTLNTNNEVINYISDEEWNEKSPSYFNSFKEFTPTNDTIIEQDNVTFYFKNGQLKCSTTLDSEVMDIITDSISFVYKKDKLTEIRGYKKEVLTMVEDIDDSYEETFIAEADFHLNVLHSTQHNSKEQLISTFLAFKTYNGETRITNTNYKYNNSGSLQEYKRTTAIYYDELNIEGYDSLTELEKTALNKTTEESIGTFQYNNKGQLILFSENDNDVKRHYQIEYSKNKKTITTHLDNQLSTIEAITYDQYKNPIEVKTSNYEKDEKTSEETVTLSITYFE